MFKLADNVDINELRRFGLGSGIFISIIFGLILPLFFGYNFNLMPWFVSFILIFLTIIAPYLLCPVYFLWVKFSTAIGLINTRILLLVVFFGIILPIGLLGRFFRGDILGLNYDADADTYRIKSEIISKQSMEKPF